jgi:5-methylcytosine-specific restriction endonuclease McrA
MPGLKQLAPRLKPAGAKLKAATYNSERHVSRGAWETTRKRILRRDKGLCQCVGCKATGRIRPAQEVDHITPLWEGGTDADANLQSINVECHKAKTAQEQRRRIVA